MNVDFSEVLTASGRKMSVEASMSNMKESFLEKSIAKWYSTGFGKQITK